MLAGETLPAYGETEILDFLKRRARQLDAVCISGGEPTLQQDLPAFIVRVRETGLKVKLDTNGTQPRMLELLLTAELLDYVAVDIKAPRNKYAELCGVPVDYTEVLSTVTLLRHSSVEHEFRTTFVPGLLQAADILAIAAELAGCSHYVLQKFQPSDTLIDPALKSVWTPQLEEMEDLAFRCRKYVQIFELRGF